MTTKNIIMPGDQFAKKGTTAWADWQRSRLRHALKDVNVESREIVQVIRDMCEEEAPAWHLMTRSDGTGFRTFADLVTTPAPEGLGFPDHAKFRALAISERGVMNEKEYDLLTAAPDDRRTNRDGGKSDSPTRSENRIGRDKLTWLRSIARAEPLIRRLYTDGLIDLKLAALMGRDDPKAGRALAAVQAITRNGDDTAYRKQINDAVRTAFGKAQPTPLERMKKAYLALKASERKRFLTWAAKQEDHP